MNTHSEPESIALSSAALVTVAEKVQRAYINPNRRDVARYVSVTMSTTLVSEATLRGKHSGQIGLAVMRRVIYTYSLP